MFTNQDVMELRKKTGAGVADCKKALTECDGDMEKAVDFLREKVLQLLLKRHQELLLKVSFLLKSKAKPAH